MILGASSFAGTFPELEQEVESVELYIPKLGVYEGTRLVKSRIKEIRDTLSAYNMSTSVHAPYFADVPTYPKELVVDTSYMNDTAYRLMTESIMIAEALESEVVVIHPGIVHNDRNKSFEGMVAGLSRLAKFAGERNVMLGLENKEGTCPGHFCCPVSELIETIERVGSENLRATFDIGHANLTCAGDPSKLREFARALSEYVVHVHVHDNRGVVTDEYWGDFHGAPGTGVVDFSVLNELDFNGVYNLEVFSIEDLVAGKRMLLEMKK